MSTDLTWQTNSTSSEQTEQLAEKIGANLRGGETIELVSDLGGGKTTFTRGLLRGLGSTERVASPTFTISRTYRTPKGPVYHFDFYRLGEAGIVADELAEAIADEAAICVVEWGEIVHDVLPANRVTIYFDRTHDGEDHRKIRIQYSQDLQYVMENI